MKNIFLILTIFFYSSANSQISSELETKLIELFQGIPAHESVDSIVSYIQLNQEKFPYPSKKYNDSITNELMFIDVVVNDYPEIHFEYNVYYGSQAIITYYTKNQFVSKKRYNELVEDISKYFNKVEQKNHSKNWAWPKTYVTYFYLNDSDEHFLSVSWSKAFDTLRSNYRIMLRK
jgi:hypothetical protein